MANVTSYRFFKLAGVDLNATAVTADQNSDGVLIPQSALNCALYLFLDAVSGTSPTLDARIEMSFDGGVTWVDTPIGRGTLSEAVFTQVTTTDAEMAMVIPVIGDGSALLRLVLDLGGTSPNYNVTARYSFDRASSLSVL